MPEWLLWMAAVWFVLGCGTGCRRGVRTRRMSAGEGRGRGTGGPADAGRGSERKGVAAAARSRPSGATPKEGAVATLQRQYVEGVLSLEQYEAELDRLDRRDLL